MKRSYAVVPRDEYEAFRNIADEDESDIVVARRVLEDADEEFVPFEFAERVVTGVHPVLTCRSMTASSLATLIDCMCRGLLCSRGWSLVAMYERFPYSLDFSENPQGYNDDNTEGTGEFE